MSILLHQQTTMKVDMPVFTMIVSYLVMDLLLIFPENRSYIDLGLLIRKIFFIPERRTYLTDEFSISWLLDSYATDKQNKEETLFSQYLNVS